MRQHFSSFIDELSRQPLYLLPYFPFYYTYCPTLSSTSRPIYFFGFDFPLLPPIPTPMMKEDDKTTRAHILRPRWLRIVGEKNVCLSF